MTAVAVRPLIANLGCEVVNFDIASADESQLRELDALYRAHSVLVVRDQQLSPEQLTAFASRFGALVPATAQEQALPGLPGHPGICFISNKDADGRPYEREVGRWWHTDGTTLKTPGLTTILYGITTPAEGGDTLFADAGEAFASLPAETQHELEQVRVVHSLAYLIERAANHRSNQLTPEERASMPDVVHPIVLTNPATGRKAFYLTAGSARGVVGMADEDGRRLVKDWIAYATQDRFVYRHRWQPGDVLVWNDVCTLHQATDYDGSKYDRLLYRCWVTPTNEGR
jgi:taurine dioxygenase